VIARTFLLQHTFPPELFRDLSINAGGTVLVADLSFTFNMSSRDSIPWHDALLSLPLARHSLHDMKE
jgi:hypothetical protein